ncbi:hypothetical protein PaecuDRAFT_3581 [Paenibacillus curdlanolyticus YK9]|uniref:Uncharacterized protein n=1 Tax=Paenibacillus curdlanolyticus YK9 TaxID=717606 RepID=E0ID79_9BACL|nr:hypothetical protein PaecuDRAFT_3581 [Paenibacillus curdlanolyticus YK9]
MFESIFELIVILILAIVTFRTINRLFKITYFGFKALFVMFVICCLIAGLIVDYAFSFIAAHYIWTFVIVIVVFILFGLAKSKSRTISETQESEKI